MLSNKLPEKYRQMVRFVIVGTIGTGIQYLIYWAFLMLFDLLWPEAPLTTVAYTLGFVLETITNYLLTTWYTFSTHLSWKNFGGFLTSRLSNYLVQVVTLQVLLCCALSEETAGLLTMIIAGVVNFFVVRFFFKK